MKIALVKDLLVALNSYRQATSQVTELDAKEDYVRLAAIVDKIIAAMNDGDMESAKLAVLGFSRQVSDSYATQPPEFKALANLILDIKKTLI